MHELISPSFFKDISGKARAFAAAHKSIAALIGIALVTTLYGSFHTASAGTETRYILGAASRGTVIASVSGTGTVSASNQVDIKSKASGDAVSVSVKAGDTIKAGQIIASLDAQSALDDLKSAEISYEKLTEPADTSSVSSAESALADAQTSETKAYNDAEDDMSSMFLDMPTILDNLDSMYNTQGGYLAYLSASYVDEKEIAYRQTGANELYATKTEYEALIDQYKSLTRTSATSTVADTLAASYKVSQDLAQTLKDTKTAVDYMKANTPTQFASQGATAQSDVASWTNENAGHLSALLADENAITTSHLSVADKTAALAKVNQGADPLDLESAQLTLEEKQQAYSDAFIKSPIDGVVGKVDVKKGDSVSTGTVVATIISANEVANVSLNEVDAAKVKAGDKATLTFDAVDGLSITGTVTEIDLVGTVTQGVVTYNAEIAFDTEDPRVLPGMSTSAQIITDSKTDALVVPSSAVKTQGGVSTVQVFDPSLPDAGTAQGVTSAVPPTPVQVETGLVGDTNTEIVSGLSDGEQIVVRTLSASAAKPASAPSGGALFGGSSAGRTTGGATRALGR